MYVTSYCTNIALIYIFLQAWSWFGGVQASLGDNTHGYKKCNDLCKLLNCTKPNNLEKFKKIQGFPEKILLWSCEDECGYMCMWKTVDYFKSNNLHVPQFYGKWPFVRFLGIQEPASMLFSLFNLLANIYGFQFFLSKVSSTNPFYRPCMVFAVFAINAWVWSTIFHTRDVSLTEKLDYFSATAAVLYSCYLSIHRMTMGLSSPDPDRAKGLRRVLFSLLLIFLISHVSYLSFSKFDYGYNMFVNIVAGLTNAGAWFFYHFATRNDFSHQWKATYAASVTMGLVIFEISDFVPIWWVFDGHSLWHLGTVIFPYFWYPFLVDECNLFANRLNKMA